MVGGGGGWARCHRLSLPPGNPASRLSPKEERLAGRPETGGRGDPGGGEGGRLGFLGPARGGGWGPGRLDAATLPSPPQQTHIFIHSFNKYTFIRSCLCQALCWARGSQGREVNEAVAEASGKVEALRTRTPLPPSLGCLSRRLPLLLAPVATSVTSPVDMHSLLRDQHGLSILCSRVLLHIFCCI